MKKLLTSKTFWIPVLVLVLVVQATLIGALAYSLNQTKNTQAVATLNVAHMQLQTNALESANSYTRPVLSVPDNSVYLTDLRLKLPLNTTTQTLLYGVRSQASGKADQPVVADVTTQALASYVDLVPQRLACIPVRIAFETKSNPYNPHETNAGSVKLADGRTMQIYSFSEDSCTAKWKTTATDPTAIATALKQAVSYYPLPR